MTYTDERTRVSLFFFLSATLACVICGCPWCFFLVFKDSWRPPVAYGDSMIDDQCASRDNGHFLISCLVIRVCVTLPSYSSSPGAPGTSSWRMHRENTRKRWRHRINIISVTIFIFLQMWLKFKVQCGKKKNKLYVTLHRFHTILM